VKRDVPRACVRDFDGWVKRGGAANARTLERTAAAASGSAHVQRLRTWAQASKSRMLERPRIFFAPVTTVAKIKESFDEKDYLAWV
jgi:hypothetical protein